MSTQVTLEKPVKTNKKSKPKHYAPGKKISPFTYVALSVMAFLSMFPFYWMFVVASNTSEAVSYTHLTLPTIYSV